MSIMKSILRSIEMFDKDSLDKLTLQHTEEVVYTIQELNIN